MVFLGYRSRFKSNGEDLKPIPIAKAQIRKTTKYFFVYSKIDLEHYFMNNLIIPEIRRQH